MKLQFAESTRPEGFSQYGLTGVARAEGVIRELLQNSVDAGASQVTFRLQQVPLDEILGIDEYRAAFLAAVESRRALSHSPDEERIRDRIEQSLSKPTISILWCVDNGGGMSARELNTCMLRTQGNTTKPAASSKLGSYGMGHMSAFRASALRYVLYATRTEQGDVCTSGEAILAAHQSVGDRPRSDRGILCARLDQDNLFGQPDFGEPNGWLLKELDAMVAGESGLAVGMVGFDGFPDDNQDAFRVVAAKHFLPLVWDAKLRVAVDLGQGESVLDDSTVEKVLESVSDQKLRSTAAERLLAGGRAFDVAQVLRSGEQVSCEVNGVKVRVWSGSGMSRVHLFRGGMWITDECHGLARADFSQAKPFVAAAVMVDGGPLGDLVRQAEGPSHHGVHRQLLAKPDQNRLAELIAKVRESIVASVGQRQDGEPLEREGFAAVVPIGNSSQFFLPEDSLPPDDEDDEDVPVIPPGPIPGPGPIPPEPGPEPPGPPDPTPPGPKLRPGKPIKPSAVRRPVIEDGQVVGIDSVIPAGVQGGVGIRMVRKSGSDISCDRPVPDQIILLSAIQTPGALWPATGEDSHPEIVVDGTTWAGGEFRAMFSQPVADSVGLRVSLVKRKNPR